MKNYVFIKNVFGSFDCSNNNLKTLEGCPQEIYGRFLCFNNKLETLEYLPKFCHNLDIDMNEILKEKYGEEKDIKKYIRSKCDVEMLIFLNKRGIKW